MSDLVIHVHVCTHNEEKFLPYFIEHYKKITPFIFVHDQNSTDNTVQIAKQNGCVVDTWGNNNIDELYLLERKYNSYKESSDIADFVFIVDTDELLFHENIVEKLKKFKENGIKVPYVSGYDMYYENFNYGVDKLSDIKYGVPSKPYSKRAIIAGGFDKIDYEVGCHVLNLPVPDDNQIDDCIVLCHYKWINFDFIAERHKYFATRLSQNNIDKQWGIQYVFPHEKMINDYTSMKNNLVQIFT